MKLRTKKRDDGTIEVLAPSVGLWRDAPREGSIVVPGDSAGGLETLGRVRGLEVPEGVRGIVRDVFDVDKARSPVDYATVLFVVDPSVAGAVAVSEEKAASAEGLRFVAPMSGRFYQRPSPDKPVFVKAGDTITKGQAIGLLEVMKTFNRVLYEGDELPDTAKVVEVVPADGDDINRGDAILILSPSANEEVLSS